MPKQTFLKLPIEKQKKVLAASIKEFSRVSFNDASIANIIKSAGIPRGSFYQYFEDKSDVFYHVLDFYAKDIKKHLTSCLIKYKGDLVDSFVELYKYVLNKINEEDKYVYFKNIFLNMNYKLERMFTPNLEDNLNEVINLVDINNLNIAGKLQLIYILEIVEATMMRNIIQSYKRNITKEKNIDIFIKEMYLIRDGIIKK